MCTFCLSVSSCHQKANKLLTTSPSHFSLLTTLIIFLKFATALVDLLFIGLSGHISHIRMGTVTQYISYIHYNRVYNNEEVGDVFNREFVVTIFAGTRIQTHDLPTHLFFAAAAPSTQA